VCLETRIYRSTCKSIGLPGCITDPPIFKPAQIVYNASHRSDCDCRMRSTLRIEQKTDSGSVIREAVCQREDFGRVPFLRARARARARSFRFARVV